VQVGRDSTNGTVIVTGNYMPMGLDLSNWRSATISKNVFASSPSNYVVKLVRTLIPLHAQWDNNTYVYDPSESEFLLDAQPITASEWRAATRFDSHSKIVPGAFQGTKVFLRGNHYQRGRANIIVYNWDNLSNVPVNVNSVLPRHWSYELRNAQDFNAAPVLSGVFDGKPLQLPMTNLTVASVNGPQNGPLVTAPPTGPKFNVFVLLSRPNQNQRFQ